jgi:hypothetical protein
MCDGTAIVVVIHNDRLTDWSANMLVIVRSIFRREFQWFVFLMICVCCQYAHGRNLGVEARAECPQYFFNIGIYFFLVTELNSGK